MKIKIVKNKHINALLVLMLFSAIVHMLILFYFTAVSGDLYILNYFNILDLDIFLPNVFNSVPGNVFSVLVALGIYIVILVTNKIDEV